MFMCSVRARANGRPSTHPPNGGEYMMEDARFPSPRLPLRALSVYDRTDQRGSAARPCRAHWGVPGRMLNSNLFYTIVYGIWMSCESATTKIYAG